MPDSRLASWLGQLYAIETMCPRSLAEKYIPLAKRNMREKLRQAHPTVGVYTTEAISAKLFIRTL